MADQADVQDLQVLQSVLYITWTITVTCHIGRRNLMNSSSLDAPGSICTPSDDERLYNLRPVSTIIRSSM